MIPFDASMDLSTKLAQITPVLLSGGKSLRMGTNKSFVHLGEKPLIEIVAARITEIFARPPLIVTNEPAMYEYLACPMTSDIFTGQGPLGGIHAALTWVKQKHIFIFACDMPFIAGDFVKYMVAALGDEDILLPRNNQDTVEPLHGIYSVNCLPVAEKCLLTGKRSILAIFSDLKVAYIEMHQVQADIYYPEMFMNINTLEHLKNAERILDTADKKFSLLPRG